MDFFIGIMPIVLFLACIIRGMKSNSPFLDMFFLLALVAVFGSGAFFLGYWIDEKYQLGNYWRYFFPGVVSFVALGLSGWKTV